MVSYSLVSDFMVGTWDQYQHTVFSDWRQYLPTFFSGSGSLALLPGRFVSTALSIASNLDAVNH